MKESTSREKVLKGIRNAQVGFVEDTYDNIDLEKSVYTKSEDPLDIMFAKNLVEISGNFIYCENNSEFISSFKELISKLKSENVFCLEKKINTSLKETNISIIESADQIDKIDIGITSCEYLIARTGSVMVSTAHMISRKVFIYAPIHIVVAYTDQLVYDVKDALKGIKEKYGKDNLPSLITTISGPSRTADIEKTLILGAHGPKELYVFMIDKNI